MSCEGRVRHERETRRKTHLSEVGSVSLTGGLGGNDLVGTSGTGVSAESNGGTGAGNLSGLGVGLDLGDGDTTLSVGVDVDGSGVGETRVLVGVEVQQVSLLSQQAIQQVIIRGRSAHRDVN